MPTPWPAWHGRHPGHGQRLAGTGTGMTDEPSWLTLSEAAERSGLNREAIRARARRGLIVSRKSNSGEVLVQMPAGLVAGDGQGMTGKLAGDYTVVADLQAEVLELKVALARSEAERDAAKATAMAEKMATREVVDLLKTQLAEARKPMLVRLLEALRRR